MTDRHIHSQSPADDVELLHRWKMLVKQLQWADPTTTDTLTVSRARSI